MKDELGRKIITEFAASSSKTYSYLLDDGDENKKQEAQKSVSLSEKLNLKITKIN